MTDIFPTQVISEDALRWINFFNGRLLTGDDLTQEQATNRDARQRLGQALGDGVIWGLQVKASPGDTVVQVGEGEAVNRLGQVLFLSQSQTISLLQALKSESTTRVRWFNACETTPVGYASDAGLYLLTLCPAEGVADRAPLSGLSSSVTPCNSKYRLEGVQFKLILIAVSESHDDKFRNAIAYEDFFAFEAVKSSLEVPFSTQDESYGKMDGLRPDSLTDGDVPLALIYRDANGVEYVDNWPVRRRVRSNAQTPYSPWPLFLSDRRTSEMEAIFLQFQAQIDDITQSQKVDLSTNAKQWFKYLPPAGFLPTGSNGLDWHLFLGSHAPVQETQIDSGLLDEILSTSLQCQPFQVETPPLVPVDVFTTPENSFVLFARTTSGRLRLTFDSLSEMIAVQPSDKAIEGSMARKPSEGKYKRISGEVFSGNMCQYCPLDEMISRYASVTISAQDSNLEVTAVPDKSGVIVSSNLLPGTYFLSGNLAGLGTFHIKDISIVGGRINTHSIQYKNWKPGHINLDAAPFRFCLVPGTFADAVKHMGAKPWRQTTMVELVGNGLEKVSEVLDELNRAIFKAETEVKDRLFEWQMMLADRYPDLEIEASQPRLFIDQRYTGNREGNTKYLLRGPQAYAVFGNFGIPLTITEGINQKKDLTMLFDLGKPPTSYNETHKGLALYGIVSVDQIAGAWEKLIVDSTHNPSPDDAIALIEQAIEEIG